MAITFKGGIHPLECKHLSESKPIEVLPAPDKVFVLVSQHAGAPAKPLVKKGDDVKLGQKIAEAAGYISANIHSPVSGKVVKIEDVPHFAGGLSSAIIIENDGQDALAEELESHSKWQELEPSEFAKIASEAGIVGMGGAMFPTAVKLSPPKDKKINIVIINGAECEPYLTADHRLMLEYPERIVEGAEMIKYALGAKRLIIAIERNKPDAIKTMIKSAKDKDIEIAPLKTKYPQGAEKQLIYALTKHTVPSGGLPFDVGCYVQNVGTAMTLRDAVIDGKPLYERVVTVSGPIVNEPKNLLARVGTPFRILLETSGGTNAPIGKVISGGPMMGLTQWSLDTPVTKGTSGLLVLPPEKGKIGFEKPCISCANCVDICPMNLMPTQITSAAKFEKFDIAKKLCALDCIECGSCSYICPSNINLLHYIRWAKWEIRQMQRK